MGRFIFGIQELASPDVSGIHKEAHATDRTKNVLL